MLSTRDLPQYKRPIRTENEGLEISFLANEQGKRKAKVAIHVSYKIYFKTKAINRHSEGYFIILKGRIHQEDINI